MIKVSGLEFSYSMLCNRKLWLYHNKIALENGNENVMIGRLIDNQTYKKHNHNIMIDDIANIDYIKNNTIYEVKKSDKNSQMAVWQVKYYLYLLHLKDIRYSGEIKYPLLKKSEKVELKNDDIVFIENQLKTINLVFSSHKLPKVIDSKICKSCAYYELCYV